MKEGILRIQRQTLAIAIITAELRAELKAIDDAMLANDAERIANKNERDNQ